MRRNTACSQSGRPRCSKRRGTRTSLPGVCSLNLLSGSELLLFQFQKSLSTSVREIMNTNMKEPFRPSGMLESRISQQRVQPHITKVLPTFHRNLEEALDVRRASQTFYSIVQNTWQTNNATDFCSGDILGLGSSPQRQAEFLSELARHPGFTTGSSGVRLMDGNYKYLEEAEREIAAFHGASTGMIVGSACKYTLHSTKLIS